MNLVYMLKDKLYDYIVNYVYNHEYSGDQVKRMYPQNDTLYEKVSKLMVPPTQITDRLYLGNAYNAIDKELLHELNIGLIVNVTKEIPNYYEYKDFQYIKIPIYDDNNASLNEYFDKTTESIILYMMNNLDKNVLVHCYMGSSRSTTIVVAYLLHECNFKKKILNLIDEIKTNRPHINLNLTFLEELNEWKKNKLS
jgi:hypothetical protein